MDIILLWLPYVRFSTKVSHGDANIGQACTSLYSARMMKSVDDGVDDHVRVGQVHQASISHWVCLLVFEVDHYHKKAWKVGHHVCHNNNQDHSHWLQ